MAGGTLQTRHVIMLHKVTWLLILMLQKLRSPVYQLSVLSILRQPCLGPQDQESTRFLLSVETGSQATRWQWLLKVDAKKTNKKNKQKKWMQIKNTLYSLFFFSFWPYLKTFTHSKGSSKTPSQIFLF